MAKVQNASPKWWFSARCFYDSKIEEDQAGQQEEIRNDLGQDNWRLIA